MVASTYLRDKLRVFADPDYSGFTGFPPSKDAARQAWADAFSDYFDQVQDAPPSGHPMMNVSAVNGAFFGDIGLDPTTSVADAAADFAGAWKVAVESVVFVTYADATSTWNAVPPSFSNVAGLHGTLKSTLAALFADVLGNPPATALARLGDIATAFHTATTGLTFAVQRVPNSTPPPTIPPTSITLH